jgi:hypothetical protein
MKLEKLERVRHLLSMSKGLNKAKKMLDEILETTNEQ